MGSDQVAPLDLRQLADLHTSSSSAFELATKRRRNIPESARAHVRNVVKIPLVGATAQLAVVLTHIPASRPIPVLGFLAAATQVDRCIQGQYVWQHAIRVNHPKLVAKISSMQEAFRGRLEDFEAGNTPKGKLHALGFRASHTIARHALNGAVSVLHREPDWSAGPVKENKPAALHPPMQSLQPPTSHTSLSFTSRALR